MGNTYEIYNEEFMDKELFKDILFGVQNQAYQMDATDVSLVELGLVDPTLEAEDQKQFDFYHPASIKGTGWNPMTKNFHMEAKTWFYCLELNIKEDGFKISYCNSWGKYINVNKTYNTGDIVRLYMVSDLEFAEKQGARDADINIYYVLPFLDWYKKDLGLPYAKGVVDDIKVNYLIQEHRPKDNTLTTLDLFDYGYPKLVKTTVNLTDNNNTVIGNILDGGILTSMKARDKFNRDTEDVYYVVNTAHPRWIEDPNDPVG
jgi:hypothetical protein